MELRYAREAIVGTLVIIAITIFVLGTMWLSGRTLREHNLVRVRFENVSGLKRASPVTVSGVPVGRVEKIELQGMGNVVVSLSIPPRIQPRTDASAEIAAVGLVGDYVVAFDPGRAPDPLPRGQVIAGRSRSGFSDRAAALSDRADSVLLGLQELANKETAADIRSTLRALQGTLGAAERTLRLLHDTTRGPTAELTRLMGSMRGLSDRLDSALGSPALRRTLGRTDTLTANLAELSQQFATTGARLDSVLQGVHGGRGTIGKFATDSGLYQDLRDLSGALKGLIAELQKNPGKLGVTVKLF